MLDTASVALLAAVISALVAWYTARKTVAAERMQRQSELALRISELVSAADEDKRRAAMRRFAVAVVKVVEAPSPHEELGKVHFIPMNSRVTVGREDDNDIVLFDEKKFLSRWHCGFIADQHNVWIDDYISLNGTSVQNNKISEPRLLTSGDTIELGPFKLAFRTVRENTILSQ